MGSGGIARRRTIPEGIARAANAELAAVYDVNEEVNRAVARAFGAKPASSLAQLLECEVDAVYIATPPNVHWEQTVASAASGKHVLCEKPLGLNVAEAEAMAESCCRAGVRLGTAFMMRFHAQHQAALQLIQQGRVGKPVLGRAQLSCWYPPLAGAWRQDPATGGGGSLMDMGGHCIDLLAMFFGKVRKLCCLINRTVHPYPSEDSAVVSLWFESGALGVVDAFFCIPDEASQNRLELYGSKGSILAQGTIGQGERGEMMAWLQPEGAGYEAQQSRAAGIGEPIEPPPVNTYQAEIEEFSRAILEGREPANHAGLGLQSQRVLAACYQSARLGCGVSLE
jgi:predicted dehydrogenase